MANLDKSLSLRRTLDTTGNHLPSRRNLEAAQRKLIEWQPQTAEEKYLNLHQDAPDIVQRIPQHYIASYFGIKPQSLSRIRKKIMGPVLISSHR